MPILFDIVEVTKMVSSTGEVYERRLLRRDDDWGIDDSMRMESVFGYTEDGARKTYRRLIELSEGMVIMENEKTIKEIYEELPDICFSKMKTTNKIVVIKKGESGYYPSEKYENHDNVDELNENIGVSKAQMRAMEMGSMYGWNIKGIDPKLHEEKLKKEN